MSDFESQDGMSYKEMAEMHTALWGGVIGLSEESVEYYVHAVGNSMDQFNDFGITSLKNNVVTELLGDHKTVGKFGDMHSLLKFNAVVAATVAALNAESNESDEDLSDKWLELMQLQASVGWASLVWAYLYGFRKGKEEDNTSADAFDDAIAGLDLDD